MKNFKRATFGLSFLIALLCLCGCEVKVDNTDAEVELYKCSGEQLELVKKEMEICKETGYLDSYCFRQAKKTQCEKISVKQNVAEQ
jgi:hypothetical protein